MTDQDGSVPIARILIRYAGALPLSDDAVFDLLMNLERAARLPKNLARQAARYPMRIVQAVLPEFDEVHISALAVACGQERLAENMIELYELIHGAGQWNTESSPSQLRELLADVAGGTHPDDALASIRATDEETFILQGLLHLDQYWYDCILDRVIAVRSGGGGWRAVSRELQTRNPFVIRSWIRAADRVIGELTK